MIFVPYPSLSGSQLHARSEPIDFAKLRITPSEALAAVPGASDVTLVDILGAPAYIMGFPQPNHMNARRMVMAVTPKVVSGVTGRVAAPFNAHQAARIAGAFGGAPVSAVEGPIAYDQWVVTNMYDRYRPFFRVSLADGHGTQIYVSAATGRPIQLTTRSERVWNWGGSILHWIYFTPIRESWNLWVRLVWWVSFAAFVSSLAGVWLGIYRFLQARSVRRKRLSPFSGWLRWHHVIGLFASIFVVMWIFSGWLSMDHGYWFSQGAPSLEAVAKMKGSDAATLLKQIPFDAIAKVGPATQIDFNGVDGHAFMTVQGAAAPRVVMPDGMEMPDIDNKLLLAGVMQAWPGAQVESKGILSPHNMYYGSEELHPGIAQFDIGAPYDIAAYIDKLTGQPAAVMDNSRRAYAWLYFGMHTLKVPGLIAHPALRESIELILLALGFVFSVTGVIIGVKRLQLDFRNYRRHRAV